MNGIVGTCQARVWDNGDTTDCGKPVLRAGLCPKHLQETITAHRENIQQLEADLAFARKRLDELQTESG